MATPGARRPPNPLRSVFNGFAGSIIVVGGAVATIAAASTAVSSALVRRHRRARNVRCGSCEGGKFVPCRTCRGKRAIEWQPIESPTVDRLCLCPTCQGTGLQKCVNCLGFGFS
jgi:hypothetical protein